jgi:hypothetical protein
VGSMNTHYKITVLGFEVLPQRSFGEQLIR